MKLTPGLAFGRPQFKKLLDLFVPVDATLNPSPQNDYINTFHKLDHDFSP